MTTIQEKLTDISNIMLKEEINEQDKIDTQNKLKDIHNEIENMKNILFYKVKYVEFKIAFNSSEEQYIRTKTKDKICKLITTNIIELKEKYETTSKYAICYALLLKHKIHKDYLIEMCNKKVPMFFENNSCHMCCDIKMMIINIELIV